MRSKHAVKILAITPLVSIILSRDIADELDRLNKSPKKRGVGPIKKKPTKPNL